MDFPKDILFNIIRKMDIDTRRCLNIYTKLTPPKELIDKLKLIPKITIDDDTAYVFINKKYKIIKKINGFLIFYTICFHKIGSTTLYNQRYNGEEYYLEL